MSPDEVDLILVGTGMAPLFAALKLIPLGKKICILNPDPDFFLENSELPLDPFFYSEKKGFDLSRVRKNTPQFVIQNLRPFYPGAVEFVSYQNEEIQSGSLDAFAPRIRARQWVFSVGSDRLVGYESSIRSSGTPANAWDAVKIGNAFPGVSRQFSETEVGLQIPNCCDWDLERYRQGAQEYVIERIGAENIYHQTQDFEISENQSVRFRFEESVRKIRAKEGILFFWTPRLNFSLKKINPDWFEKHLPLTQKVEEWILRSREPLDQKSVGVHENAYFWPESEVRSSGANLSEEDPQHLLRVLLKLNQGEESISRLHMLCRDFLGWDKFLVRSMKPRVVFQWNTEAHYEFEVKGSKVRIITGGDGSLSWIAENVYRQIEVFT